MECFGRFEPRDGGSGFVRYARDEVADVVANGASAGDGAGFEEEGGVFAWAWDIAVDEGERSVWTLKILKCWAVGGLRT